MKVATAHFGNYSEVLSKLGQYSNWEFIVAPAPTDRTIELGSKYLNELMCLPAKVTLGSFIELCEQDIQHFIMFDSCGQCRLKCYWILQERALRKLGYNVTVHPLRLGIHTPWDIRAIDPSIPLWKAWQVFYRVLHDIARYDKEHLVMEESSNLVKIGIIGEIYTVLEPAVNGNIFGKLEKMGVLVHNSLPLSYFTFKALYDRGWMKREDMDRKVLLRARKAAHSYFPREIGGHGTESIIHAIYYALKGFDGVMHLLPFPCMPESTVAPIIDDISHDYSIPVMRLVFDTHTGKAGLDTRLEAFTDILKRKKQQHKS